MRSLLVICLLAAPAFAERPLPTYVPIGPLVPRSPLAAATPSSKIVYLHRCPPAGCNVMAGSPDDARTNTSRIADGNAVLGAFNQTDDTWKKMLSCVRTTFAPFDVTITDVDPGTITPHYEHMVGGRISNLTSDPGLQNAGGVAPFDCDGVPNALSFTFDVYGDDFLTLCWTASQEIAHGFGLEHELDAKDPLTYLAGNLPKRFQASDAQCGEGIPRICSCTGGQQNSYMHILGFFGPGVPTPPMLVVKSPTAGKTVQPGFVTRVTATDDVLVDHVEIIIEGVKVGEAFEEPFTVKALDIVEQGPHTMEVKAVDIQGTPASVMVDIVMGPPCTASNGCTGDDVCLAGLCVPGPNAAGGLGYECSANTECISRACTKESGSTFGHCTEPCDVGVKGQCPGDFSCIPAGAAGVCWPNEGGGCCDAGGSPSGPVFLTFGVLVLVLRRRAR